MNEIWTDEDEAWSRRETKWLMADYMRHKIGPILWLLLAAVIIGASIGFSARAQAQPPPPCVPWPFPVFQILPQYPVPPCMPAEMLPPPQTLDQPALNGTP